MIKNINLKKSSYNCYLCSKPFWRRQVFSEIHFCSRKCQIKNRILEAKKECENCRKVYFGKKFSRGGGKRFCSKPCANKFLVGKNSHRWVGERIQNGYLCLWDTKSKKSYYVHRLTIESHIGRKLKSSELIHHKNGIKTDNRLSNLQVISRKNHMKLHSYDRSRLSNGKFAKEMSYGW